MIGPFVSFARRFALSAVCCLPPAVGCGDGKPGSSEELTLPQKIEIADRELDPAERARKLLGFAVEQRKLKNYAGATETTEKAELAAREVTDANVKTQLLTAVAEEFAVLGRSEQSPIAAGEALLAADSIKDRNTRLEAEARLVLVLQKAGDRDGSKKALDALAIAVNEVADPADRVSMAALLSATAATIGDPVAEVYSAEIDAYAAKIADVPQRIKALSSAAGRLYRGGQGVKGRERLDAAVVAARAIADPAAKADALLTIFETLQDLRKSVPLVELLADAKIAATAVADEKTRNDLTARVQSLLNLPE